MDISTIKHILAHPNENGVAVFVLGILFILSTYHFLLYFQHKDKSYLYYSLYTSLMFIGHLGDIKNTFITTLVEPIIIHLHDFDSLIMWSYNAIYYIFAFTFLDLKSYSKKWHNYIFRTVYLILTASILVYIYAFYIYIAAPIHTFGNIIIPVFVALGLISYYPLFKFKLPLRWYFFWGSFILLVTSLSAVYLHQWGYFSEEGDQTSFSIFYIGVLVENLIFSLGLGQKQKRILQEKDDSQKKLIAQLKENETLRNTIQVKLEKDIEHAHMGELKAKYDKELVELKMTSLRSQMNPHFIFNSLNAIKLYIIDNEKENAVYYLNKFSKLIRKILAATREKTITLAEEIETTKLYLDIENIRFSNKIEITTHIDKDLSIDTIKIPSLILQPFIENAIWHGLSSKQGVKQISISFTKESDTYFIVSILDNGVGREKSAQLKEQKIHKKESLGIKLTEERLANFCKDMQHQYSLKYIDLAKDNIASGTKVVLRIPLL